MGSSPISRIVIVLLLFHRFSFALRLVLYNKTSLFVYKELYIILDRVFVIDRFILFKMYVVKLI